MNCPACNQPTDPGAAYCGNCGQALDVSPIAKAYAKQQAGSYGQTLAPLALAGARGVPLYALASQAQHLGETKAVLSLMFGIIGILGVLFAALIGLGFGIAGVALGTMSRRSSKHTLSTVGLIVSSIAVVASLTMWTYVVVHQKQASTSNGSSKISALSNAPTITANSVTTPCYTASFAGKLSISNATNTCDIQAYDGNTLEQSSNAYKVYGYQQPAITAANFALFAKAALEKDVHVNLPGFSVSAETTGQFAGSLAYIINATNDSKGVAYVEAAVLHAQTKVDNIFVFVHATAAKNTDINTLESQWQWK